MSVSFTAYVFKSSCLLYTRQHHWQKNPQNSSALFSYLDAVGKAYRVYGGMVRLRYDEQFRQRKSMCPSIRWDYKDIRLWTHLMVVARFPLQLFHYGERGSVGAQVASAPHATGSSKKDIAASAVLVASNMNALSVAGPLVHLNASEREEASNMMLATKGVTMVKVDFMQQYLNRFPNRQTARFLLVGFFFGFRIPFSPSCPDFLLVE